MIPCPCGSGKLILACCGPILAGKPAPTAEVLMRSRYTAYATGKLDYIEETCAGPAAKAFDRLEAERSGLGTEWLGLTITGREAGLEGDETGKVSFTFRVRQNGQEVSASEVSLFRKIDRRWFYWDREDKVKAGRLGRNDPCPCGSGKKFKACHGA
ncbi:YchJ family protein [Rhizobium sp. C1]|uniref:YchJ family protein n=1 Tax=Rhizobium sp. C1 TaxID=1349799 RepID=UPI001E3D3AE1|nr:YchJ family protein [Rhizobium sp. C1]MCD2177559.1 YchJ family protein [Rhizobium sp. C1]